VWIAKPQAECKIDVISSGFYCLSYNNVCKECPTLWRIYQYVGDEDRVIIMQTRKEKKKLGLGNGGEGYIASEEWCYNCGNSGHLGDVCIVLSPDDLLTKPNRNATSSPTPSTYPPSLQPLACTTSRLDHSMTRHLSLSEFVVARESCRMRQTNLYYKTTGGWMHPYMLGNKGRIRIGKS